MKKNLINKVWKNYEALMQLSSIFSVLRWLAIKLLNRQDKVTENINPLLDKHGRYLDGGNCDNH